MAFDALVTQFGLPIALLFTALILGARRTWVWGSELEAAEARAVTARADCEQRLDEQRESHLRREQELAASAEKWQALFLQTFSAMRGLTEVVDATTRKNGGAH